MPNILLVDDTPENLSSLEAVLADSGARILKATSGEEALRILLEEECALILLDVQMPDMDGFETANLIRGARRTSQTPILFVTAIHSHEKYVLQGYEAGAVDYLCKPLNSAVVRSKVRAFLELEKQRTFLSERNAQLERSVEELRTLNQELEMFASTASHDLKEPMRMVSSYLALLRRRMEGRLDSTEKEYLQFASGGAKRLQKMVTDLLELSRISRSRLTTERCDTKALVETVLSDLAVAVGEARAEVRVGPLPEMNGSPSLLVQVFQNLIQNALKFRASAPLEIRIAGEERPHELHFTVSDNGVGIPEDSLARVFELFARAHSRAEFEGNGIGLATCKKIVERHGGSIWVESREGVGSTFHLVFPRHSVAPPLTGGVSSLKSS